MEGEADPLIGRTLGGKYAIKRLIGRGGVGLVYLAAQTDPHRQVVVKLLAPNVLADDESVKRFDREARRLESLRHPNIVEMFDSGHDAGRAYLVMEYLQGELLSDFVTGRERLLLSEFVPIAAQILKGVGHAHSRELMVRDIKPANIMLCERKGRANFIKILDFGLAKLLRGEEPITEAHILGTVGYLAPEAIKGQPLDLRVDVYALGVLFYYMLTGKLPFDGESNVAIFYKTINQQPPPIADQLPENHDLPDGLIELVNDCLAKEAADRPRDANEVVERLIDVVPASMFRLPRAKSTRAGVPSSMSPGAGNTGMMELVASSHTAGDEDEGFNDRVRAVTSPLPEADTNPGSPSPLTIQRRSGGFGIVAGSLLAGALIAVLGGAAAAIFLGDEEPESTANAAIAGTDENKDTTDDETALDGLTTAEGLIAEGRLDAAAAALDEIRGLTDHAPALSRRLKRADHRIRVARLMASARILENTGEAASAMATFEKVLEAEPSHAEARAALNRLSKPTDVDPVLAPVAITSRPLANLYIDGESVGTTPFRGELPVGRHQVRLTARGYNAWTSTISVTASKNLPLSVRLHGRGKAPKDDLEQAEPEPPPEPLPEPEPAPEPRAEHEPEAKPEKKRNDVFLPTSNPKKGPKKNNGVFLPTDAP